MTTTEQQTIAIEAEQQKRRDKYAKAINGSCDDVCQSAKLDSVAVFLGKMRHAMEVLLSEMRSGKVATPDMPDDVADVMTDRVAEAIENNDDKVSHYEVEGIEGTVSFVKRSTYDVKFRDVVAFISDDKWGFDGMTLEETFAKHTSEPANWNDAFDWLVLHVNSLAIAKQWRAKQTKRDT